MDTEVNLNVKSIASDKFLCHHYTCYMTQFHGNRRLYLSAKQHKVLLMHKDIRT